MGACRGSTGEADALPFLRLCLLHAAVRHHLEHCGSEGIVRPLKRSCKCVHPRNAAVSTLPGGTVQRAPQSEVTIMK